MRGPSFCSRPFPALADFTICLIYLVDVMLLADDGEREKGAGVCGVILWNEELGKGAQKSSGMEVRLPPEQESG